MTLAEARMYDCAGGRDPAHEAELGHLLRAGGALHLLERGPHAHGPACLAHLPGCCLQR